MKTLLRDYPLAAIALLLLACVKFEYNTTSWTMSSSGLGAGVLVLGVIAIVMLFRIFNAAQDACIARGLIASRIRCKYDMLIPISVIAVAIHGRWLGEPFQGAAGKSGRHWEVVWSDPDWAVPFVAALVGVVLLVRVLLLLHAIVQEGQSKT